ncbi:hypothetical protein GGS20DRAFT_564104 [Poronia punctata]|nr:hypothetical protein GGS20DRAFT_564104 [Poronia punctata]
MAEGGDNSDVQTKPHPFFLAPNAHSKDSNILSPPTPDPSCSPASDNMNHPAEPDEQRDTPSEPQEPGPKRRKTSASTGTSRTSSKGPRKTRRARGSAGPSIISHFNQTAAKDQAIEAHGPGNEASPGLSNCDGQPGPNPTLTSAVEVDHVTSKDKRLQEGAEPKTETKPQKVLKFNPATGTIGSPPRPKISTPSLVTASEKPKKRGRKRKAMVITIAYGNDVVSRERIGSRIRDIISGISNIAPVISATTAPTTPPASQGSDDKLAPTSTSKTRSRKMATAKKPAHPFFQAKGKPAPSTDQGESKKAKTPPKRQVIFSSTPCSPGRSRTTTSAFSMPPVGSKYSGGMKIPGAQHPAWPWRGMVHIRDNSEPATTNSAMSSRMTATSRRRKAKGQAVRLGKDESILSNAFSKLRIHELANDIETVDDENLRPIATTIRVPTRHFESGRKLQARIYNELRTMKNASASSKTHPAIQQMYQSISTSLSAFDRSTCESITWAQKYAPTSARCVLQSGREADMLRDWLQTLKVQAVDTGVPENAPKPKTTSGVKKRRKTKKLEGFVVSSDDDDYELDEVSENEAEWFAPGGRNDTKRTVVRSGGAIGKPGNRLTNAVLLSGPHGCGKTATVYAIAKELGFEVFEINAGSRRSGKDILERVGDMTRNHQVRHQQRGDAPSEVAAEDEVAKDLKSGKQGMMTAFFQTKPSQPKKEVDQTAQPSEAQVPAPVLQEKKLGRDQKQSLILLEEVDVLYEEDKQFWSTVITMIAQSKRPFVMTCNNEAVVPLQSLKLHGIFRLSPPPTDLAVDLLLLIAANEGHALGRHAVEALYESRSHDLRAAITELNYWCQVGVGDLRGGFDWFYPRWPKGKDVDAEGHTIRVVSQDTYHTGMGWFNRDLATTPWTTSSIVPELQQQTWEHWGLDLLDHHEQVDPSDWAKKATEEATSPSARLALLQSVEAFADRISEADICGPFLPSLSNHIPLDATSPDLHIKSLDDFTVGNKLVQVTPVSQYDTLALDVSTSIRVLAHSKLVEQSCPEERYTSRYDENWVTDDIQRHIKTSGQSEGQLTRMDCSIAFDPIAASDKVLANGYLDPSVFDSTMTSICLDVAPYVRSIVAYDQRLQNERRMRGTLISEGGKPDKKRMRTTRAALSALEGGSRATTRREKYFAADINPYLVMRTGGESWGGLTQRVNSSAEGEDGVDVDASSNGSPTPDNVEMSI